MLSATPPLTDVAGGGADEAGGGDELGEADELGGSEDSGIGSDGLDEPDGPDDGVPVPPRDDELAATKAAVPATDEAQPPMARAASIAEPAITPRAVRWAANLMHCPFRQAAVRQAYRSCARD
ncbi:MAG: hypothetical protein DLM56_13555 [Pseudonocardiales bacterium]|nr:MAG: hypothetical protein DLM56_13555 [Pseudonocardiales bacterium]